jgi:hypothetical protein
MRRLVIRFKDGCTTSLDLVPGREREDLLRHLRYFPGKEVASVEEQIYDPGCGPSRLDTDFDVG